MSELKSLLNAVEKYNDIMKHNPRDELITLLLKLVVELEERVIELENNND